MQILYVHSVITGGGERAPLIEVVYYQDDDGTVPMKEWLKALRSQPRHRAKIIEWIGLLQDDGHDLRRPTADYLRDDIYELRVKIQRIRYRVLYFFYGGNRAVITHGIVKQTDRVPSKEIDRAVAMKTKYEKDWRSHSHEDIDDG
jgi:phage-related protein